MPLEDGARYLICGAPCSAGELKRKILPVRVLSPRNPLVIEVYVRDGVDALGDEVHLHASGTKPWVQWTQGRLACQHAPSRRHVPAQTEDVPSIARRSPLSTAQHTW